MKNMSWDENKSIDGHTFCIFNVIMEWRLKKTFCSTLKPANESAALRTNLFHINTDMRGK